MQIGKREKRIINICICYFMYVFFYGIVIKLTIFNSVLFKIKTYIPEILLLLVIIECIIQGKMHLKKEAFLLVFYSIIVFIYNFMSYGLNEQSFYLVRDIYIPLFTFAFLASANISENGVHYFFEKMIPLLKAFLILGCLLALYEQIKGWEWTSIFYAGYSFYGQDSYSKVKIAHNLGLLRAPSLTGNFATFGYYCLIANIIVRSRIQNRMKRCFWDFLTLACLILATNKSAIIAFLVVLVLGSTSSIRSKSAKTNKAIIISLIITTTFISVLLFGDNSGSSESYAGLLQRFNVWKEIFSQISWNEALFPYKQFTYGTGAEGIIGFWDNTYFYSVFSQGLIGTILWIVMLINEYKRGMRISDSTVKLSLHQMLIIFMVLALTVNVTQGRGFFSPYLVFVGITCVGAEKYMKHFNTQNA